MTGDSGVLDQNATEAEVSAETFRLSSPRLRSLGGRSKAEQVGAKVG